VGCDHINALYKFTITYLLTYTLCCLIIITSAKANVMRSVQFVCHTSVCRITAKVINRFHWNLVLWSGLPSWRTD